MRNEGRDNESACALVFDSIIEQRFWPEEKMMRYVKEDEERRKEDFDEVGQLDTLCDAVGTTEVNHQKEDIGRSMRSLNIGRYWPC